MKIKKIYFQEIMYEDFLKDLHILKLDNIATQDLREELLSLDETASFFKVSKRTLCNWHHHNILRKIQIGNRVYFRKKSIEDLIHKNTP